MKPLGGVNMNKKCQCGRELVWFATAACWVCPYLIQDERDPGERIVGLLEPQKAAICRRNVVAQTLAAAHLTCLPGELFDEDLEITGAHRYARGQGFGDPTAPPKINGHRTIVDERGVPVDSFKMAKFDTYQCDDCGARSQSAWHMRGHLRRTNHKDAVNGRGESARDTNS